jgi:hypothetical protein
MCSEFHGRYLDEKMCTLYRVNYGDAFPNTSEFSILSMF